MSNRSENRTSQISSISATQNLQIAWQNKDIISKIFAEGFGSRSLEAYGLDLPEIISLLPTNFPAIVANELRIDNLFLLADGSVAIIDYESDYEEKDKLKYLSYLLRVLQKRWTPKSEPVILRMIVIYTADVLKTQVKTSLDTGALSLRLEPAFLSELDPEKIWSRLLSKVESREPLSDTETMWFIIFPLACRTKYHPSN